MFDFVLRMLDLVLKMFDSVLKRAFELLRIEEFDIKQGDGIQVSLLLGREICWWLSVT